MRTLAAVAAAIALLAIGAAPASAGSASIENGTELFVVGNPGEVNQFTISEGIDNVSVTDAAGAIIAPPPCTNNGASTAVCPYTAGKMTLYVFAGDQNDTVDVQVAPDGHFAQGVPRMPNVNGEAGSDVLRVASGPATILSGNSGDDQLYGNSGDDILSTGPGNDFADGAGGNDSISLGPGPDETFDPAADADRVTGGDGKDALLLYAPPGAGVVATFDENPDDGVSGERDDYSNDIEWVQGTAGDDRLVAGNRLPPVGIEFHALQGNDVLHGSNGSDALAGDEGNDTIDPHLAADSVFGGPGDDVITTRDAGLREPAASVLSFRDTVACDDGSDTLLPDSFDWAVLTPAAGCEHVERPANLPLVTTGGSKRGLTRKENTVTFRSVACARDARENCRGTLAVKLGGTLVASGPFDVKPGATRPIKLKLRAVGKKQLERRGSLKVKASATTPGRVEKLGTYRLKDSARR